MRQIITSILGILLIAIAVLGAKSLMGKKETPKPKPSKSVTTVFTQTVKNTTTPITITTSGNLMAKKRMELFAEVQGIFEKTGRDFLPGEYYDKDAVLISINSDEHRANIRAQKSALYNQVVGLLPDLKLDYPESFPQWEAYISRFDMDRLLQPLPTPLSEKEKLFIAGRNIFPSYYAIKNLEERLAKYTIRAPYYGVLTEALVNHGTLIRAGQKLGEYINPLVYELQVAVNAGFGDFLKTGKEVELQNIERTKSWMGKVSRVNGKMDQSSQTYQVFIDVRGRDLREGMYLEAALKAKEEKQAFEIPRKLLIDENKLFIVRDAALAMTEVVPVFYKEKTVVVKGLEDGTVILANTVPGAYSGMKVAVIEEENSY